jgi:predicted transcriptional regulator
MKYRSRTEIISLILETVSQGVTKTKIMYTAYLSYTQLNEYMSFLIKNELIKRDEGSELYKLTEKGRTYYLKCKEIDEMIDVKKTHADPVDTKGLPHIKRVHEA